MTDLWNSWLASTRLVYGEHWIAIYLIVGVTGTLIGYGWMACEGRLKRFRLRTHVIGIVIMVLGWPLVWAWGFMGRGRA